MGFFSMFHSKYLFLIPILFYITGCDPFNTQFDSTEKAKLYTSNEIHTTGSGTSLKIMDWNVKFGGGRIDFFFDCYGDTVNMTKEETIRNLQGVANKINEEMPDILLVQEIDIKSKRTAYVNQVQWILDHTEFNYAAYASQWKSDYVPSDGVGRVDSGNAIFSKFPIIEATRISLPLISVQDALTHYFYLKRNILKTKIDLGDSYIYVLDIHTSAYSHDGTKKLQLDRLKRELDEIDDNGNIFIAGGDFNTIPPGSEKLSDFPDSICTDEEYQADDYSTEQDWLDEFYSSYTPAISLADYAADNSKYFSHTTNKNGFWNRKLDYLFTNGIFISGTGIIHQDNSTGMDTMPLSDHGPVTVIFGVSK